MRRIAIIIALLTALFPSIASAQTMTCSRSFQGYLVCQGPHGYRSTEWDRDGMRFGQDNQGNRWTTSRWQGIETTTISRLGVDAAGCALGGPYGFVWAAFSPSRWNPADAETAVLARNGATICGGFSRRAVGRSIVCRTSRRTGWDGWLGRRPAREQR